MKNEIWKWLALTSVMSSGCGALLGENFEGYGPQCAADGLSCAGASGGSADAEPSGTGGSAGLAGSAQLAADAGDAGMTASAGDTDTPASAGRADMSGRAGMGGRAGSAGMMGGAGVTGGAGPAGTAGDVGTSAGSAGAPVITSPECQPDATIIPECTLYSSGPDYPSVNLNAANGIAMTSAEVFGGGFSVYASKRASPTIALNYTKNVEGSQWSSWFCLDAVPKPERLAGGALLNGLAEIFATTRCGGLYRRTETSAYSWLPWQPFGLPSAGMAVTDVAMSLAADGTNLVYVADGGRVFTRHRVGNETYSAYGSWREIPSALEMVIISAGLRADLRQQVFGLDADGAVHTSIQTTTDLDSAFGPWSDFDSNPPLPPLLDIEAPSGGPFPLEVFAVDANGALWQRAQSVLTSEFETWKAWDGPAPPATLVSLAGAALKAAFGTPLHLTGLGAAGGVYTVRRTQDAWEQWRQLQ